MKKNRLLNELNMYFLLTRVIDALSQVKARQKNI